MLSVCILGTTHVPAVTSTQVWDLGPGSEGRLSPQAQTLPGGHSDYVLSVCFSEDGKFIISGSKDRSVTIWDARLMRKVSAGGGSRGEGFVFSLHLPFPECGSPCLLFGRLRRIGVGMAASCVGVFASFVGDRQCRYRCGYAPSPCRRVHIGRAELVRGVGFLPKV